MSMKRFSLVLSSIVVLAMLLAACGGQETTTSIPSTNVPPVTVESTGTEAPTDVATEAPTTDLTTTPGVPVTGENNSSRMSNMLNMGVWSQNNEQVGQVQDLVLDMDNSRVSYLVVGTGGFGDLGDKTVLIPWDSVQLQAGTGGATGGQQGNAFILLSDPEFLQNAPDVDLSTTLPAMGQPAGNWDADIRNFWDTGAMPSSTQSADTPSAGTVTGATDTSGTATTGTGGTGTGNATAVATDAGTGTGTGTTGTGNGNGQGQGQGQALQGVVLASDVLGSTVMLGGQGQGNGTGTGTGNGNGTGQGQSTAMPDMTATAGTGTGTDTGTGNATAAATDSGTGTGNGTGTGTGTGADVTQATVEDLIVEPATGNVRYLVIRTASDDTRWIPVPIGFLRWDATNNGFTLMISGNALQNAPAFSQDQFPDASSSGWDTDFSTFWQNNGGAGGTGTGSGSSSGGVTIATATP